MIEQEELPYTSSSEWESYTGESDWSSDLSTQFPLRNMGIPLIQRYRGPRYRNNIRTINAQLSAFHGQAAEDFRGYHNRITRLRATIRQLNENNSPGHPPTSLLQKTLQAFGNCLP